MDDFLDAPFPATREQAPDLIVAIHDVEIFALDGRLMNLLGLGVLALPVFQPVLQNADEYLRQREAPFEELPLVWKEYSGMDYIGLEEHLHEELDAAEQVEDIDNEEEDLDDEGETMDSTRTASQDVDAMSSASQLVTKRDDSITDDCRLLKDIESSSLSVATIGLQDSAMPDASPAAFVPILESVPRTSNNL